MSDADREALARLFAEPSEAGVGFGAAAREVPIGTYWPAVSRGTEAPAEWQELRAWVEQLQARFAHLDHHAIPPCWFRHNEHVELLCALRDHERCSFSRAAPATAPLEWFRALRDIAALLVAWTAETGCSPAHHVQGPSPIEIGLEQWKEFLGVVEGEG